MRLSKQVAGGISENSRLLKLKEKVMSLPPFILFLETEEQLPVLHRANILAFVFNQIPGQEYAQILQYSLSTAPNKEYYRISTKREDGVNGNSAGVVSTFMHTNLKVGDIVEISAPFFSRYLGPVYHYVNASPQWGSDPHCINASPYRGGRPQVPTYI